MEKENFGSLIMNTTKESFRTVFIVVKAHILVLLLICWAIKRLNTQVSSEMDYSMDRVN